MYAEGDKNHYFPNYYDPCITAEHFIKYHSMNFSSRNPDLIPESAQKEQLPKWLSQVSVNIFGQD